MMFTILFTLLVGCFVAAAATLDVMKHRIPNYLTVPAALLGVGFHSLAPAPYGWGYLVSLAGFGVGMALLFLPWLLGGGGMGDVKLLAALGAWLGPKLILAVFAVSVLAAAIIAVVALSTHSMGKGVSETKKKYLAVGQKIGGQKRGVSRILPFAVPVAVSTWCVLVYLLVQEGLRTS